MLKISLVPAALTLLVPIALHAQAAQKPLDIYFLDTEGGQATLFVPPYGQSMLVDTGFAGNQGMPPGTGAPAITRDADRITAVLKLANVTVLDYVVITHYHGDHAGNAAELASRIPILHFVDHGPYTVELQPNRSTAFVSYQPVREKARAITAKPGDRIPIAGLDVQVASSAGKLITKPVTGAPGAGRILSAAMPRSRIRTPRRRISNPSASWSGTAASGFSTLAISPGTRSTSWSAPTI